MSGEKQTLKLYNTLAREKQVFEPEDRENVRMYVCGPTVYDFAHIGNARPVIVFDVLFRLLRHIYGAEHVTYVRNITDVDDKINARALRDFPDLPLNEAIRKVTEKTANQFHEDAAALGCLEPTHEPRATDFVLPRGDGKTDMVGLIQSLIEKRHAYVAEGESGAEVLFDTASMSEYGQLSKRRLEEQQAGARIDVKDHKKNPADFVLWKESAADEPGWDAEFAGRTIHGRPGWHIECSAMSAAYLGETFDIHGGGLDLIFPHHENEIAQSRCAHGTDAMAKYWMHNGFLQVEGRKMSKSEGNFVTIHDLLSGIGRRPRAGTVVRLLMLATHYRQPIDFTETKLDLWYSKLCDWVEAFDFYRSDEIVQSLHLNPDVNPCSEVVEALCDDLNFAPVVAHLDKLAQRAAQREHAASDALGSNLIWLGLLEFGKEPLFHKRVSGSGPVGGLLSKYQDSIIDARMLVANRYDYLACKSAKDRAVQIKELEAEFDHRFPDMVNDRVKLSMTEHCEVRLVAMDMESDAETEIIRHINRRLAFIAEKNWAEADRIRDELLDQGIQLKDSKDPETGERITTWEVKR